MKLIKTLISVFLSAMVLSGCTQTSVKETDAAPDNPADVSLSFDYYTGVDPIVTEYADLSINLTPDSKPASEYKSSICYSDDKVCFYDLIPTDVVYSNTQNGIICLDSQRNKTRVCPEPDCTADNICNHIVLRHESVISYENYIFVNGVPFINDDFYIETCVMLYDLTTREYIKYAEIPCDYVELFSYGNYLFAQTQTGENNAPLYCCDLSTDCGYKLIFTSKAMVPLSSESAMGILWRKTKEIFTFSTAVVRLCATCQPKKTHVNLIYMEIHCFMRSGIGFTGTI